MQSSLVVWTPSKSSSRVELINDDLSTNDNFVTRRLLVPSDEEGATEASSGDLDLELAAMQTCYGQLKQLVPTVPVNGELSRLQLLQHVIDYIVDLELALHSSASMSSSPQRRQHQQPESSACRSRTTTTHINDQQSLSTVSSADEQLTAYDCDNCSTTEIAQTLPQSILNESTS